MPINSPFSRGLAPDIALSSLWSLGSSLQWRHVRCVAFILFCVWRADASLGAASDEQAAFIDGRPAAGWDVTQARGKTRQIEFETTEGTWMSLDVSPDGRWIVFDLMGHVYRVSITGGDAECLTQDSGVALNFQPRYSPDGRRIAFVSDRAGQESLWVMNADGSSPMPVFNDPMTKIMQPSWYADGTAIAAVREFPTYSMHRRSARIWRFPLDRASEAPRQLVGQFSGSQAYWPSLSRDGKSLYYLRSAFAAPLSGRQDLQHIQVMTLETGTDTAFTPSRSREIYRQGNAAELAPEISPDGHWLAFVRRLPGGQTTYRGHTFDGRTALWVRDSVTGNERILLDSMTLDMQDAHGMKNLAVVPGYAWHPDAKSIFLWRDGGITRVGLDGSITPVPFRALVSRVASEAARWTHGYNEISFDSKAIRWPSVSTATGLLVFEAVGEIWAQPLRSKNAAARPLVAWSSEATYAMPQLSTDGRHLTFVSWNDKTLGAVWTCDLPECVPRKVSRDPARYLYPAWQPDSKGIIALRSHSADAQRLAAFDPTIAHDFVRLDAQGEQTLRQGVSPEPFTIDKRGRVYQMRFQTPGERQYRLAEGKAMPSSQNLLVSFDPVSTDQDITHFAFPAARRAVVSMTGDAVAYEEEGELYLASARRDAAQYVRGESFHWEGESQPLSLIKENPLHEVLRVSHGGAHHIRWIDEDRLIYASGAAVYQYDRRNGHTERIPIRAIVPKAIPSPSHTVAFVGARVITLRANEVLESADLLVRGGRIACVGHCDTSGAEHIVDVHGKTIVPGWVDVHAHGDYENTSPIVPQQHSVSALYLSYGVTTILDPYAHSNDGVFSIAEMIEAGRVVGPRTVSTGEALDAQSPQQGPRRYEDARAEVGALARWGAVAIKTFLPPRRDQRQMYMQAARELGLAATSEGRDLYYNIGLALDGHTGFEHPLQYMVLYRDAVEFLARSQVVYTPTLIVAGAALPAEDYEQPRSDLWNDTKQQRFMPHQILRERATTRMSPKSAYAFPFFAEGVADIRRAGGRVAVGGHGEQWGLDTHWEMWSLAEALSPLEVLTAASLEGARKIGLEKQLGTLEPSKLADFVVLNTNPLEDIRYTTDISFVVKAGVQYEGRTLDELWPTQQQFGTPAWYRADVFEPKPVR
jgi:imidazolonepropionase-like amidohydrolase/Tol biopolymer transport system component